MPTYGYRCQKDEAYLEIKQSFTDETVPNCPDCDEPMNKVSFPTAVHFKGSGFYKTDNR